MTLKDCFKKDLDVFFNLNGIAKIVDFNGLKISAIISEKDYPEKEIRLRADELPTVPMANDSVRLNGERYKVTYSMKDIGGVITLNLLKDVPPKEIPRSIFIHGI